MAPDDFSLWLSSPEGQLSESALFEVMDALEKSIVEPLQRLIVWKDGDRLSIHETACRIHSQTNLPLQEIESHVVGWIEMHYEPQGLNERQMEKFEALIEAWIQDYEISQLSDSGRA